MKKQRSLPFGYTMESGKIVTDKAEARIVRRIFKLYESGESLVSISAALTKQGVPYSTVNPAWNKHKVKRILDNERYTGTASLPAILDQAVFVRTREVYDLKVQALQTPIDNSEKQIWKHLTCAECNGKIKRIGGRCAGVTLLECDGCGARIRLTTDTLMQTLQERFHEAIATEEHSEAYTPTAEILRLQNEIGRKLENPKDKQAIRKLILQAAAKRYALCPSPAQAVQDKTSAEPDWRAYRECVETAQIDSAGEIIIRLKQERT